MLDTLRSRKVRLDGSGLGSARAARRMRALLRQRRPSTRVHVTRIIAFALADFAILFYAKAPPVRCGCLGAQHAHVPPRHRCRSAASCDIRCTQDADPALPSAQRAVLMFRRSALLPGGHSCHPSSALFVRGAAMLRAVTSASRGQATTRQSPAARDAPRSARRRCGIGRPPPPPCLHHPTKGGVLRARSLSAVAIFSGVLNTLSSVHQT